MSTSVSTGRLPEVMVTAVGSLPHLEAASAVDMVLTALHAIPHSVQLPRSDPREQMWIQFSENLPRFVVDLENLSYYFDTSGAAEHEVERFYEEYLSVADGGSPEHFAVSHEYGRGIWTLLERLRASGKRLPIVKLQVTGPMSFALTVTDETRKPIFYHPVFRDVAVRAMGLKALWLMEEFRPFADRMIVFFDEPALTAYGSSTFLGVSPEDVVGSLNEVIGMVIQRGGIPGIHCCGNTDWGLLMETETQIVNFDAVDYMDSVAIYSEHVARFLDRGGILAWGAVRNTEEVRGESVDDVTRRVRDGAALLESRGVDRSALFRQIMVTPACGCAGMTVADTEYLYHLLTQLEDVGLEAFLNP